MPRYREDRSKNYGGIDKAEGTPTDRFVLRYHFGTFASDDTYLLFRVYRRELSANHKAAGFSPETNYAVADLYTRVQATAEKRARDLILEKFGSGMNLIVKGKNDV